MQDHPVRDIDMHVSKVPMVKRAWVDESRRSRTSESLGGYALGTRVTAKGL
jgi:hypothetical protein